MEAREEKYMKYALGLARAAGARGEVPVGCVVVCGERVIGRGYNLRESLQDASGHAEMTALRDAAAFAGSWRLPGAEVFVTLEPCPMCAGALVQSRVRRLIYGAEDPKAGAAGSVIDLLAPGLFNHDIEVTGGVLMDECSQMMRRFFRQLRKQKGPSGETCGTEVLRKAERAPRRAPQ